ncbi:hypothetical protein E2C06_09725 [Dankookia rubra]|uniref:Uncharacterized protein n=1 Tax=Dankookia rubra TaxID=1442381 RepID=A0A4R5QJD2_9PROT|nr:hypothetical protein [Dankookia rubra]TDH62948.1 hypothetical protein E2C06_09725 [Dankookia rubra]
MIDPVARTFTAAKHDRSAERTDEPLGEVTIRDTRWESDWLIFDDSGSDTQSKNRFVIEGFREPVLYGRMMVVAGRTRIQTPKRTVEEVCAVVRWIDGWSALPPVTTSPVIIRTASKPGRSSTRPRTRCAGSRSGWRASLAS